MKTKLSLQSMIPMIGLLIGGCASEALSPTPPNIQPTPGHAILRIVGDKNVFLDNSARSALVVEYVSDTGQPLAGTVSFRVGGDGKGAALSAMSSVTGPGGRVTVQLTGGPSGEAAFKVTASAEYATPVDWSVAVRPGSEPPVPGPFSVVGTYDVNSTFDLVDQLPGTAGDVVRTIIDLTDDPNDPSWWVIQQIAKTGPTGEQVVNTAGIPLAAALNALLMEIPDVNGVDIIFKIKEFGNAFGDAAKKFGIRSQLKIYIDPNDSTKLLAKHTIKGVFVKIDGKLKTKQLAELNMNEIVIDKIPVTLEGENKVKIGDHDFGLAYGGVLVAIVDNVLIPLLDPTSGNLQEVLENNVPCDVVGEKISEYIPIPASVWESLCKTGLNFGAAAIEGKLSSLGGTASSFKVHGEVRPVDTNDDRKPDTLVGGQWEGTFTFAGSAAPLLKPKHIFNGARIAN